MKRTRWTALAVAAGLALVGPATAAQEETLRLTGAMWWTPDGFEPGDRYVRGGVFVGPAARARTVDLKGAFVTPPGLWHAHVNESGAPAHLFPVQDAGLHTYLRSLDIRFVRS